jgi:hypothetical protein
MSRIIFPFYDDSNVRKEYLPSFYKVQYALEDCSCTYYNDAELFILCCISLSPKLDGLLKTFPPNLGSGGFFFDDSVTAQATYFQAPPLS